MRYQDEKEECLKIPHPDELQFPAEKAGPSMRTGKVFVTRAYLQPSF